MRRSIKLQKKTL